MHPVGKGEKGVARRQLAALGAGVADHAAAQQQRQFQVMVQVRRALQAVAVVVVKHAREYGSAVFIGCVHGRSPFFFLVTRGERAVNIS